MDWLRLIGLCLLASAMVMLLRQMNPPVAGLLCAALGVLIFSMLLPDIRNYMEVIRGFFSALSLPGTYYSVMLRAMGIVLITQFAAQTCRDMDAPSVASRAEMVGRIALLGVALPVFMELVQMAVDVLQ